jgi:hypothetical protein
MRRIHKDAVAIIALWDTVARAPLGGEIILWEESVKRKTLLITHTSSLFPLPSSLFPLPS